MSDTSHGATEPTPQETHPLLTIFKFSKGGRNTLRSTPR